MNLQARREFLQAIGCILVCLQILFVVPVNAQQEEGITSRRRETLRQFAGVKAAARERDRERADSVAKALKLPLRYQDRDQVVVLQRLGLHDRPVYYATDNADAANIISVDKVWAGEDGLPSLTGEGVEINVWDGGSVLATHREFTEHEDSRIILRDLDIPLSNHSTHVAGTMTATGFDADAKGMAPLARVYGWDFSNDLTEMAFSASEGIVVSNHSYGPLCGWYYNGTTERWYWYGDPQISAEEDYKFGFYDEESADMDFIAWCAPSYLIVKSAGNDRNQAPVDQPVEHLVWEDSWVSVTVERDTDGGKDGYDCLTPMAVAKNILTVGAVDDQKLISSFSAFGPTDDGRIKPDLVANGTDLYSSVAGSDNSYDYMSGTSMSAASATGSISLLLQLQNLLQPAVELLSSTIKGLLIHTADEMGDNAGPDFRYGWGLMNIKKAADILQSNSRNGGRHIYESALSDGEQVTIPVEITEPSPGIKITLCWTDPPGPASAPELNPEEGKLVNDLDLELILPGGQSRFFPWILNAAHPEDPATTGVNHVDNVEQLWLPDPSPGLYQVKISHSGNLSDGQQAYSLIVSGMSAPEDIFPPRLLQAITGTSGVALRWTSAAPGLPEFYRIYRNDVLFAETADTTYVDGEIELDNTYEYQVTAAYLRGGTVVESISTNSVTATPRDLRPLPVAVDFEIQDPEILIRDNPYGWRWGDHESLSSYYLRFQENTTHFIGIDSYSTGESSHVQDVAATLPLKLSGSSDVFISFDYMFITGIYDAIDELHVVYKMQDEAEWHKLEQIPRALNWTHYSLPFPDALCKDGTQIGFYYDDLYQWGMGAGLDNILISGETGRSIDLAITSMISPVSACNLSAAEPVSINLLNAGVEDVLPADVISLRLDVSPGIVIEEQVVLNEVLPGGESLTYQMGTLVDLSEPGAYAFNFLLSCDLDDNLLNNSYASIIESTEAPLTRILNQNLIICEEGAPVLIQCIPEGGTLSGPGVSGLYFDPGVAGLGIHTLTYVYTDPSGCQGSVNAEFEVVAQPVPVILNEDLLFCEEDAPVLIQCTPEGGILSGPGVSGLYFDPGAAGAGLHTLSYVFTGTNGCQGAAIVEVEVIAQPKPIILNEDLSFCEDEPLVMIQAIPEGGTLSGPGVIGIYLDPGIAGIGSSSIYYQVTYRGECSATTSRDFFVYEKPQVNLGSDRQVELDDTLELIPDGNGTSYLWFNESTGNSLSIIARELGLGTHDIWVEAFSPENCSAIDSIKLIIEAISGLNKQQNNDLPQVYPNPFSTGFQLVMDAPERLKNILLIDLTGRIWSDHIPSGYPWFHVPHLPSGTYILRIETTEQVFLVRIVKV